MSTLLERQRQARIQQDLRDMLRAHLARHLVLGQITTEDKLHNLVYELGFLMGFISRLAVDDSLIEDELYRLIEHCAK